MTRAGDRGGAILWQRSEASRRPTISGYAHNASKRLPAWLLRVYASMIFERSPLRPERVPTLHGYGSRLADLADIPELCRIEAKSERYREFMNQGDLCAIAEGAGGILAAVWAHIGPGESIMDGFVWRLENEEAWVHNGAAREDVRGTGVYLVAYQRLLVELASRGVERHYNDVLCSNSASISLYRRLQLTCVADVRRVRFFGFSVCSMRGPRGSRITCAYRSNLPVRLRDWSLADGRR